MIVYQKSLLAYRMIHKHLLPRLHGHGDLRDQLRRAASSISLNIAEGSTARGKRRLNHFDIALGSTRETVAALHLATTIELFPSPNKLLALLDEIAAMLYRLSR